MNSEMIFYGPIVRMRNVCVCHKLRA